MLSTLTRHGYRLGLLIAVIAALAVFVPAGFTQDPQNPPDASQDQDRIETPVDKSPDQTPSDSDHLQKPSDGKSSEIDKKLTDNDVRDAGKVDLDHLESYVGQEVTLRGDVDKIFAEEAFQMEAKDKGKAHVLVINLMPESVHPEGDMKESKPVTATGTIRMFDHAELLQDYPSIQLGSTPMEKFDGKPVLLLGEREFAAALLPKTTETAITVASIEREKPSVTEPEAVVAPVEPPAPAPEPEPQVTRQPETTAPTPAPEQTTTEKRLPRTASPLVALGLSGLLSLATGLGIRLRRS